MVSSRFLYSTSSSKYSGTLKSIKCLFGANLCGLPPFLRMNFVSSDEFIRRNGIHQNEFIRRFFGWIHWSEFCFTPMLKISSKLTKFTFCIERTWGSQNLSLVASRKPHVPFPLSENNGESYLRGTLSSLRLFWHNIQRQEERKADLQIEPEKSRTSKPPPKAGSVSWRVPNDLSCQHDVSGRTNKSLSRPHHITWRRRSKCIH